MTDLETCLDEVRQRLADHMGVVFENETLRDQLYVAQSEIKQLRADLETANEGLVHFRALFEKSMED